MKPLEPRRLDLLQSPLNRQVADYWFKLVEGECAAWPDKAEIDPVALRNVLPHLCLIDVQPDGALSYRLVGEWVRGLGVRRGQIVEDRHNRCGNFQSCEVLYHCLEAGLPLWQRYGYGQEDGDILQDEGAVTMEALVLPLTARPESSRIGFLLTSGDFCKIVSERTL